MSHPIRHLRDAQLDDKLQAQLAPFINAYRPHDEPLSKHELYQQFGAPVDRITRLSMDSLVEQANELVEDRA